MKKNVLLILLMMVSVPLVYGQKDDEENENDIKTSKGVKITKSSPYEVIDSYDKNYFTVDDGVLAIKWARSKNITEYIFQKFEGKTLNQASILNDVAIDGKVNKLYYSAMRFREIGKKIYFFYSLYDKPSTTEHLYAREVDTEKGGFAGPAIELIKVSEKITSSYGQYKFLIDFSEDESKIIVRYQYLSESKKNSINKQKFGMVVFDDKLEKVWENDVQMPYVESEVSVSDFTVDSKGRGYFLMRKTAKAESIKESKNQENISYEIFEVTEEGKGEIRDFKLEGNVIRSIVMKENGAGNLVCAGYYSKPRSAQTDGAFSVVLDEKGEFSKPNLFEFSVDFIKQYNRISERKEKKIKEKDEKGELGMNNLIMRRIQNMSDGSLLLTGEIYYVTSHTDSKGNTTYTYHYDDVILTKINKDGSLDWFKKIPKRSTRGSFRQFASDSYVYIAFRDNVKNQNLTDDLTPYRGIGAVITYKIELEEGNHDYKVLFSANKIDETPVFQFDLDRIIPLSDTKFAIETYIKNKQDMMFQIEFE